jgi:hypothetical protein
MMPPVLSPLLTSLAVPVLLALAGDPAAAAPSPAPAAAATATADDFADDARLIYLYAACGPLPVAVAGAPKAAPLVTPEPPAPLPAEVITKHCAQMRLLIKRWRQRWVEKAVPFLAEIVPADLPAEVVYPFGGGDLFTALATFPRATTITTLSLEPSGNPLTFAAAPPEQIEHALGTFLDHVRRLSFATHSKTTNLLEFRHEVLPDQLAFALLALVAFDLEPMGLRFFEVTAEGTLVYLSRAEILGRKKRQFANMELSFRRRGDPAAPTRIHRHLQANLADQPLGRTPGVIAHLESKGPVAAMTKAASYLLWSPSFTRIRNYLLAHADFMISDSTGIPPHFAAAAGFEQQTWGKFTGPFLTAPTPHDQDFAKLWADNPQRPLEFGFGYPDREKNDHLLVTRRKGKAP